MDDEEIMGQFPPYQKYPPVINISDCENSSYLQQYTSLTSLGKRKTGTLKLNIDKNKKFYCGLDPSLSTKSTISQNELSNLENKADSSTSHTNSTRSTRTSRDAKEHTTELSTFIRRLISG